MKQAIKHYAKKGTDFALKNSRNAGGHIARRKHLLLKLPGSKKIYRLSEQYRFVFAVSIAIVLCLMLTVFSIGLYAITGTSKLDLSRPGYEAVRKKVSKGPAREDSFSNSGALNSKVIGDYLASYKKQADTINSYDIFAPNLLDDVPLGLVTTQVAPSDGATQ